MNLEALQQQAGAAEGLLKAVANRRRLTILCELTHGERSVSALGEAVGLSQSALSQHLARLPVFRGVAPLRGLDGLVNPRGFVIVDKHQQNPKYSNVFGVGVCVAIAPVGPTPVPCGVPKTGFMIESMVTATALNIGQMLRGEKPTHQGTWNAICLADFGDSGVAFVAQPQIPPRNVNWSSSGKWVHGAKLGFEKYFLRKMRKGASEPFYETAALKMLGSTSSRR